MTRREILYSVSVGLFGWMFPAVMRFTGAMQVKPQFTRVMFIIDVSAVILLGIIITYMLLSEKKPC